MPSRSKLHFLISDIPELWHSVLSARVPECHKLKMLVRPGWQSVTRNQLTFMPFNHLMRDTRSNFHNYRLTTVSQTLQQLYDCRTMQTVSNALIVCTVSRWYCFHDTRASPIADVDNRNAGIRFNDTDRVTNLQTFNSCSYSHAVHVIPVCRVNCINIRNIVQITSIMSGVALVMRQIIYGVSTHGLNGRRHVGEHPAYA